MTTSESKGRFFLQNESIRIDSTRELECSTGNLSQNPQEAVIATYICFWTNFTELELTNIQANYWWGQMHCGPPNQNFGLATAHPAHAAAPPCVIVMGPAAFFLCGLGALWALGMPGCSPL